MAKCPIATCPVCNDKLIHQSKRGSGESSSAYGQFVHDYYPKIFDWMDVDAIVWKAQFRILRFIEDKPFGQVGLKDSQLRILPMLARFVDDAKLSGFLHEHSGVFVFYESKNTFPNACTIERVLRNRVRIQRECSIEERKIIETGLPLTVGMWNEFSNGAHG